jgi:hypothetical protein
MQTIECSTMSVADPLGGLFLRLRAAEKAFVAATEDNLGSLKESFQRESAAALRERLQAAGDDRVE